MYRVFLGAPTLSDLSRDSQEFQWKTISCPGSDSTSNVNSTVNPNVRIGAHASASLYIDSTTLEESKTISSSGIGSRSRIDADMEADIEVDLPAEEVKLPSTTTSTSDTSIPNPSFGFEIPSEISGRPRPPSKTQSKSGITTRSGSRSSFVDDPLADTGPSVSQRPTRVSRAPSHPSAAPIPRRKSTLISFPPLPPTIGRGSKANFSRGPSFSQAPVVVLPAATIEAASVRVSAYYRGAIFDGGGAQEEEEEEDIDEREEDEYGRKVGKGDQTTMYTWPPTAAETTNGPSIIHTTHGPSVISAGAGLSTRTGSGFYETQDFETQEQTYNTMSEASIAQFPNFHFSLHSLTSLSTLTSTTTRNNGAAKKKHNFLLAILEIDPAATITLKKGPDAGKEVTLLSMVLGDEEGRLCKLTAWREVAEDWGGLTDGQEGDGAKRGDVVYIENVTATVAPSTPPNLTASPSLGSRLQICYRTLPSTREDARLRPDLRLGESDAGVRKVKGLVGWFERMAGLR